MLSQQPSKTVALPFEEIYRDLIAIAEKLPPTLERQLGYFGGARFVWFHYEPVAEDVLWNDGVRCGFGCGSWRGYSEFVEPVAARHGVEVGRHRERGMVFLLDRRRNKAYFAPWATAKEIVETMQDELPDCSAPAAPFPAWRRERSRA